MLNNKFGDLKTKATYEAFSSYVFSNTVFLDNAKWDAFIANPDTAALHKDPAFMMANAFNTNFNSNFNLIM